MPATTRSRSLNSDTASSPYELMQQDGSGSDQMTISALAGSTQGAERR